MKPRRNRHEAQLSRAVYDFLLYAKPRCVYTAVPNGGSRSLVDAVNLKRQGVVAGAGDFVLTWDMGSGWIELKTGTGRLGPAQQAFAARCAELGVKYEVCRSVEAVQVVLKKWGLI